jgi:broad specificity polyphosphatase/5'/3'-nucleotidase SurE
VNVPSKPLELINGIKITKLSNYGLIKTVSKNHETGTLYLDLSPHELNLSDETDISALRSNYVSVTPIETVRQLDHETLNAHIFDIIDHVWNQSVKR